MKFSSLFMLYKTNVFAYLQYLQWSAWPDSARLQT